ncbi:MAG: hypothetical protein WKG07_03075 [Hymenobacter sp.]
MIGEISGAIIAITIRDDGGVHSGGLHERSGGHLLPAVLHHDGHGHRDFGPRWP